MASLRTEETEKMYQKFLKGSKQGCPFCLKDLLLKEYRYWVVVDNKFPYDLISSKHHLLATKRHIAKMRDLNKEELKEYYKIVDSICQGYSYIARNTPKLMTVPAHLHLHLIKLK